MFGKLFDKFDDFDPEKMMEVVNLVWNNREKIMDLIERLPQILKDTGDGIESAGDGALNASALLLGTNEKPGAQKIAELAADALDRCQVEIDRAAEIMSKFGEEIDDIRIPSLKPEFREVMGFNVITGLDMGENKLVDNAADRMKGGADRLEDIGQDLKNVAAHLRDLGGTLTDTGQGLNNVGEKLKESGGTLRSVTNFASLK